METELVQVVLALLPAEVVQVIAYAYVASFVFNLAIDRFAPHTDARWLEWMRTHPRAAGVVSFLRAFPGHPMGMARSIALLAVKRKPDAILEAVAQKLPPPPPLPILLAVIAAGAGGLSTGCGATSEAMEMVRVSNEIITDAEPCLLAQYERALNKCLVFEDEAKARECADLVDAKWESRKAAFDMLRKGRCSVEPEKCKVQP